MSSSPDAADPGYRQLFALAPAPMWVYDQATLVFLAVNDAAVQAYGWSEAEFLAMTLADIRSDNEAERLRQHLAAPAGTRPTGLHWRHRKRNGEVFDVEVMSSPVNFDGRPARLVVAKDITRRLRAQAALRASERRYRDIVDTAEEGIWAIDAEARTTFVNPKMARMLGTTVEDMQGRALGDFTDADGMRLAEANLARRRTGLSEQHEFRFLRKDGSTLWAWVSTNAVHDEAGRYTGALAMVTDITERKRAAARDAGRERVMTLVAAGAPLPAVLDAIVRGIEDAHPGMVCSVLLLDAAAGCLRPGAAPGLPDFYNQACDGLAIGPDVACCGAAAHSGERVISEDLRTDPRWAPYLDLAERAGVRACWSQPVLSRGGAVLGTFGVYHREPHAPDAAELAAILEAATVAAIAIERKQADEALRQSQRLESLGTLAGGVAHDFNNILGAVLGNVALARQDGTLGAGTAARLAQIEQSALRARLLVQQILAFSRRQPHSARCQPLAPMVQGTLDMLRVSLPSGVALHTRLAADLPDAEVDATQLQQVLMNLCTNAWHAMPDGKGTVEIGLDRDGDRLHLWVRDDGAGMDEATRQRAFEPFFTTRPVGSGTGLGLAVVHGIVAEHGGTIRIDSTPGHGTTVHIHLPAATAGPAALPAPPGAPATPAAAPPTACSARVLFVDDDAVMLVTAEALLARLGYQVTTAGGGREALAAVHAGPAAFDLVVTDYNMPGCSGLEVAAGVAQECPGLPVLICSGYIDAELQRGAEAAGVRALVRKEHVVDELAPAIEQALARRAA